MMIEFREVNPDDYDQLRQFLSGQGWADRLRDVDRFRMMIEGADRTVIALLNKGFAVEWEQPNEAELAALHTVKSASAPGQDSAQPVEQGRLSAVTLM